MVVTFFYLLYNYGFREIAINYIIYVHLNGWKIKMLVLNFTHDSFSLQRCEGKFKSATTNVYVWNKVSYMYIGKQVLKGNYITIYIERERRCCVCICIRIYWVAWLWWFIPAVVSYVIKSKKMINQSACAIKKKSPTFPTHFSKT